MYVYFDTMISESATSIFREGGQRAFESLAAKISLVSEFSPLGGVMGSVDFDR